MPLRSHFARIALGITVLVAVSVLSLSGCGGFSLDVSLLGDTSSPETRSSDGVDLTYSTASSGSLLTMAQDAEDMRITVSGTRANGLISAITSLSGQSADVSSFSVEFAGGEPYQITLPSLVIEIEQVDSDTFTLTIQSTDDAAQSQADLETVSFETGLAYRRLVVSKALDDDCKSGCLDHVEDDLEILDAGVMAQTMLNFMFELKCMETQTLTGAQCYDLLGAIDALGAMMDAVVATNPDLPDKIKRLCFNLSADCPDNSITDDPNSDPDPIDTSTDDSDTTDTSDTSDDSTTSVSATISGVDEISVGGTGTYSASVSPYTSVTYSWSLLGTGATLNSVSGSTTTVTGTAAGTVSLVVEARSGTGGNVLATDTHTISVEAGPEYVVWYDTGNACWDAPLLRVSTRESYDNATAEETKSVMQGGFASSDAAWSWICSAIQSKFNHAWCSTHFNIGGSYYTMSNSVCDTSSIPSEN